MLAPHLRVDRCRCHTTTGAAWLVFAGRKPDDNWQSPALLNVGALGGQTWLPGWEGGCASVIDCNYRGQGLSVKIRAFKKGAG